jgi:hypothetical protein
MSWAEERRRIQERRRAQLSGVVPERGPVAWFDRGAWYAMAQDDPSRFSWPKAMVTIAAGIALALVIYATFFHSLSFVVGLGVAYLILLIRAYTVHVRYRRMRAAG